MTLREARHAYHGEHLWWHPGDDGRCWDNTHGRRHSKIHSSGGGMEGHAERQVVDDLHLAEREKPNAPMNVL